MILVGNQRGGARDLACHLMKVENERVEVHELRGFVADDLEGAFQESYAISRGTQCKQFLFSLSLSPPKGAEVSNDQFIKAIDQAEGKLGLSGQPRAVVFHEKRGDDGDLRRHAHAVWSRIDSEAMKAVQLSHSKRKLNDLSRDLYLEHGWKMPRGLAVSGARDPLNHSLAEWQQAKRIGKDPREIKAAFQDAWAISDTKTAFAHALRERGYWLCRGDKRGYVAMDVQGEVHNIAKRVGLKTKAVRARLGEIDKLKSVAETRKEIAQSMQAKMQEFQRDVAAKEEREQKQAQTRRKELDSRQMAEREALGQALDLRTHSEEKERQQRLRTGIMGLWDRLTGTRKRTLETNARESDEAKKRDVEERSRLNVRQQVQQDQINQERSRQRNENKAVTQSLNEDAKVFQEMAAKADEDRAARKDAFRERRRTDVPPPTRSRDRPEFKR